MSQDYDANCYYGDDTFLKTSSFETEKNKIESRLNNLESRNKALEWKNKALTVSMTVFLVFLLIGTVTMLIFHELIIEQINNNLILKEHKVKVASMNGMNGMKNRRLCKGDKILANLERTFTETGLTTNLVLVTRIESSGLEMKTFIN